MTQSIERQAPLKTIERHVADESEVVEIVEVIYPDGRIELQHRRPPGVRVIVANKQEKTLLLVKEIKKDIDGSVSFGLPGGKMFHTLAEMRAWDKQGIPRETLSGVQAGVETIQEAGVEVLQLKHRGKRRLHGKQGAQWDVYFEEALAYEISPEGPDYQPGETILSAEFYPYDEVLQMMNDGRISEEITKQELLAWFDEQPSST